MKYLGSVFSVELGGVYFRVSFDWLEFEDSETGINVAEIQNIKVFDHLGESANRWVDMEEFEKFCFEKAIEVLNYGEPSDLADSN